MACNCSKKRAGATWTVRFTSGDVKTYTTETEAHLAAARSGGGVVTKS